MRMHPSIYWQRSSVHFNMLKLEGEGLHCGEIGDTCNCQYINFVRTYKSFQNGHTKTETNNCGLLENEKMKTSASQNELYSFNLELQFVSLWPGGFYRGIIRVLQPSLLMHLHQSLYLNRPVGLGLRHRLGSFSFT